ncbi:protein SCO1/2 [Methylobacterium brachiatum]|uniref:Protein SCO1/2 n=1 Tax=Methylobacterium brachiatum TaxID=269660 RepID=A0AAJ1U1T3_9HYPH|nr:SCO family protein [Methylobacterium brachiatum]MCB4805464.1 SCO family protein [Methylobacterium brachiatum]MDQ0546408.1 protein SCO1/2 [Methylobacterium brachiatum]
MAAPAHTSMRFVKRLSSPSPGADRAIRSLIAALLTILGGLLVGPVPARARLVQADLARVAVAPPPSARVPLELAVTDARTGRATTLGQALGGRAALLLPVDYTCGNVCDPMASMAADALAATGLAAEDYAFVLVGIDPRDDAAAARRMLAETLGDRAAGIRPLLVSDAALAALTGALGYKAVYDAGTDSFAHPAAAMLIAGDGRVARVLSPLALTGRDLRLALTEAGEGRVGSLADRLTLLCYGYDAARGLYTPLVQRILTVAGIATILGIGLLIVGLTRRTRLRAG